MKFLHNHGMKSASILLFVLLIIGIIIFSFVSYIDYKDITNPPPILYLSNKDTVYMLTTDGRDGLTKYHDDYGHYLIFPITDSYKDLASATSEYPAYIAKASVSLEPYVNKKVKYG